jgi:hypothetical protein
MAEGALEGVVFDLMEAVHVELSNEAVHLVVAEVVRQDDFFEFHDVFDDEFHPV